MLDLPHDVEALCGTEYEDVLLRRRRVREKFELLIGPIRRKARELGYAIGVHGSLSRDIDLIAVPWTEAAVDQLDFAQAIIWEIHRVNEVAFVDSRDASGATTVKPLGRRAFSVHVGGTYIDLSVMPKGTPHD